MIALNDGSTINNVQIVVDLANFDEQMLKEITTGACFERERCADGIGRLRSEAEIQAREIEVLGTCDNTYPLQEKRALYGVPSRDSPSASSYEYIWSGIPYSS